MQQFLFVVDMPIPEISSQDQNASTRWLGFAKAADAIQLPHGSQRLSCKNVWIFPSAGNEQLQRDLANSADAHQLNHSTFLISGEITSLTSKPKKHTAQMVDIRGL